MPLKCAAICPAKDSLAAAVSHPIDITQSNPVTFIVIHNAVDKRLFLVVVNACQMAVQSSTHSVCTEKLSMPLSRKVSVAVAGVQTKAFRAVRVMHLKIIYRK
jgi:hypothetical protein